MARQDFDAIVVGAGHNGMTAAAYLARAGKKVLVLEARQKVGGMATTEEFHPGFRASTVAQTLNLLHPRVLADLDLEHLGLTWASRSLAPLSLGPGGPVELGKGHDGDSDAWRALMARLARYAGALAPALPKPPPSLATDSFANKLEFLKFGWGLRKLGRRDMRDMMRIVAMNASDLGDECFAGDRAKGALAFDAIAGTRMGPRSPGTVYTLLYRMAGAINGRAGAVGLPAGGMGAVADAFATAARARGVEIRTGMAVTGILVENDHAVGVVLDGGDELRAPLVLSNADPRTTFLHLVGPTGLDTLFSRRVHHWRDRGVMARLHLALDAKPQFGADVENARMLLAESRDAVERAFDDVKYGAPAQRPVMEAIVPSLADPSLAPDGKHVLSATVAFGPPGLDHAAREAFADRIVARLAEHALGLPDLILGRELLLPDDIAARYGVSGGHWHHGEISLDQVWVLRQGPGVKPYRTPIPGLYLAGAGAHPGGNITGLPGRNAALAALEDLANQGGGH
ncbi:MAG: NAD(P)/FAD-dependent oxidoreductase [Proteobacteria bacterium]|nr:NAD(P)/FAD-dependent oxidoreductase [Pseudomonadota bacterium]MDA0952079.1 NAD(P)/FAD-dependent oxidoreductase [Pseudomonadota bacterium]